MKQKGKWEVVRLSDGKWSVRRDGKEYAILGKKVSRALAPELERVVRIVAEVECKTHK